MLRRLRKTTERNRTSATKSCGVPRIAALAWSLVLPVFAGAQQLLTPSDTEKATQLFTSLPKKGDLRCAIYPRSTVLDLAFQFTAGYGVRCPVAQFEGKELPVRAYLRITPGGSAPVFLGEVYRSRALPSQAPAKRYSRDLAFSATGGFTVGEGKYSVEFLLIDPAGRFCRKQWSITATRKEGQRAVPLTRAPNTVSPPIPAVWDDRRMETKTGLRVTILLDAAPINWHQSKLYAWDRSLLLNGLVSLLQRIPCRSARVVAFNLEQQREIFRQDQFDRAGFATLARSLEGMDTWTVPLSALKRGSDSAFLTTLAATELNAPSRSDVMIFFGPTRRPYEGALTEKPREDAGIPLFYFELTDLLSLWEVGEFPDAIDHLTKKLHGRVFRVHSAGEFAEGIQETLAQLKQHSADKPTAPAS